MNEIPTVRYPYPRSLDWAALRFVDIPDSEERSKVYLRRFIVLKTPVCGLYVHWIYTTDVNRHPHDHPMKFCSFVWLGGYVEAIYRLFKGVREYLGKRMHLEGSFHVMDHGTFHRITHLFRVPTVTVVAWWNPIPDWGYLRPDGRFRSAKRSDGRISERATSTTDHAR